MCLRRLAGYGDISGVELLSSSREGRSGIVRLLLDLLLGMKARKERKRERPSGMKRKSSSCVASCKKKSCSSACSIQLHNNIMNRKRDSQRILIMLIA